MSDYVGDFETTRNVSEDGIIHMRVWLFDICQIGAKFPHFTFETIEDGFNWLAQLDETPRVFFHNLKFDGSYIVDYLFRHGYEWTEKPSQPGDFYFLISDMGQWFHGKLILKENGKTIEFLDSSKKIPLSVKRIGEKYGGDLLKGEIDYNLERYPGYKPTKAEIDYIHRDTEIVARALQKHFSEGMTMLTIAGDAFAGLKKTVCDHYKKLGIMYMRQHPDVEEFCRLAYCGGISYVNPDIQERELGAGFVYDVNSLYPYVMSAYPYPVYNPIIIRSYMELDSCLWIAEFDIKAELIPGRLPTLRAGREWIDRYFEGKVVLTSIDFEMMLENYVVDYEFVRGYKWRDCDPDLFKEYVRYWGERKMKDKGGDREIDKLMLNSSYGKFGLNPIRQRKKARLAGEEDLVRYSVTPKETMKCNNVAIATFVTAYARRELLRGVNQSVGFCYCDTDSVHLATIDGIPPSFSGDVDPVRLGAWKLESTFQRARYLRQKTYIEEDEHGILTVKACGMPEASKRFVTWENFRMGASFPGKLLPMVRPGGVDLVETDFTIHETTIRF